MNEGSLLSHLRDRFGISQGENLATEALAWILNGYPSALASTHRVLTGLQPKLASLVRVETQSWSSDEQAIPDLIGIGRGGTTPLVVEVKFDASLTPNQPVTYLDRLSATTADGLLAFLVPARRKELIWGEVKRRCAQAGHPVSHADGASGFVGPTAVCILSWTELLNVLEDALGKLDDRTGLYDVRQLRGMCNQEDREAFVPLGPADLDGGIGRRMRDYASLIFDAVENQMVAKGIAEIKGLSRSSGTGEWYGRYALLAGWECLVHVNFHRWATQRPTPLWVRITDRRANGYRPLLEALAPLLLADPLGCSTRTASGRCRSIFRKVPTATLSCQRLWGSSRSWQAC
jgi:hypothetical protein